MPVAYFTDNYDFEELDDETKQDITNGNLKREYYGTEEFVEQDHPRDRDGKFTSKDGGGISNSKPNSKAETAQKWQNKNISQKQKDRIDNHFKRNEEAIEKSDYKDLLRKLSDNYPDIMEKISKKRSSICTYDPKTQSFDDDRAGTEMLCGPSSTTIFMENLMFTKSNIYSGYIKGGAYDNHRRKDEYENMGGKINYIDHMFIEMDDGTIVDGAYGQVYPKEVNINADMRLRIISPDDPDYGDYVKKSRHYPFLNKDIKLTKENDFGKKLPKSMVIGLDESFKEEEHPRDRDGKFTDKDGGVIGSKAKGKGKTKRKTKRKKTPKYKPIEHDSKYSWRDTSKPLTTANGFHYRSRMHDIKIHKSRGKKHPETVYISDTVNPEYIQWFTGFWNNNPSVKAMIKHIDKLTFKYSVNPKNGGRWVTDDKEVTIMDYPRQNLPFFKSTTVHEIVGHTFWDWARDWNRNELIEFNELANKMTPVNQYVKDNEEKWRRWNDETNTQIRALDKKYGVEEDRYGYTDASDPDKYQEELDKINDGKFIGNPSNKFMNRDSSSMTRYANEQHSAITEIMYGTLNDSPNPSAIKVLMGDKDLDRLKVLWKKLHPKFVKSTGKGYNLVNEALICDTVE